MNNKFTDREKGFEQKFKMDEELQFKIAARSNKYLGEWASLKLGKDEKEKEIRNQMEQALSRAKEDFKK